MDFCSDCDSRILNVRAMSNIKSDSMPKDSPDSCFSLAM